jgi:hypothetical protein
MNTEQALAKIREDIEPGDEVERLISFIETAERGFVK